MSEVDTRITDFIEAFDAWQELNPITLVKSWNRKKQKEEHELYAEVIKARLLLRDEEQPDDVKGYRLYAFIQSFQAWQHLGLVLDHNGLKPSASIKSWNPKKLEAAQKLYEAVIDAHTNLRTELSKS